MNRLGNVRALPTRFKAHHYLRSVERTHSSVQAAVVPQDDVLIRFRTSQSDPRLHTENHVGRFYTIPPDLKKRLFSSGGIATGLDIQMKTFQESCIIVRKPAVEILSFLNHFNYSHPALRFVIYGKRGNGKSSVLMQIVHYAYVSKHLLLHVPWVSNWTKRPKEYVDSTSRPGRIDLPIESTLWLQHFKLQNAELLKELNLKTSKEYTWSIREKTEEGTNIMEIMEHGLNRVRHASDCIAVLLKEIKHHSQFGNFKTMVVIDGVNSFYTKTNIRLPNRVLGIATNVTIIHAFEKMLLNDWTNAAIVTTVDDLPANRDSLDMPYTPRALLGKEGFERLDPFIPIHVDYYTEKEINSVIDYYIDRMWIQTEGGKSEAARKELIFLSGGSPYTLRKLCDPL